MEMSYNVNAKDIFKGIFCLKKSWLMNYQFLPSFMVIFPETRYIGSIFLGLTDGNSYRFRFAVKNGKIVIHVPKRISI